jgi:hypothetical protein
VIRVRRVALVWLGIAGVLAAVVFTFADWVGPPIEASERCRDIPSTDLPSGHVISEISGDTGRRRWPPAMICHVTTCPDYTSPRHECRPRDVAMAATTGDWLSLAFVSAFTSGLLLGCWVLLRWLVTARAGRTTDPTTDERLRDPGSRQPDGSCHHVELQTSGPAHEVSQLIRALPACVQTLEFGGDPRGPVVGQLRRVATSNPAPSCVPILEVVEEPLPIRTSIRNDFARWIRSDASWIPEVPHDAQVRSLVGGIREQSHRTESFSLTCLACSSPPALAVPTGLFCGRVCRTVRLKTRRSHFGPKPSEKALICRGQRNAHNPSDPGSNPGRRIRRSARAVTQRPY